jgi:hypothetical protein
MFLDVRIANGALGSIANIVSGTSAYMNTSNGASGTISGSGSLYRSNAKGGNHIPLMNSGTTVVPANDEMRIYSASAAGAERITVDALHTAFNSNVNAIDNLDSPYAATAFETMLVDTTTADVTVDLPVGAKGDKITIKKTASANTVTIDGNSTDTIDDSATVTLTSQYESMTIIHDSINWQII